MRMLKKPHLVIIVNQTKSLRIEDVIKFFPQARILHLVIYQVKTNIFIHIRKCKFDHVVLFVFLISQLLKRQTTFRQVGINSGLSTCQAINVCVSLEQMCHVEYFRVSSICTVVWYFAQAVLDLHYWHVTCPRVVTHTSVQNCFHCRMAVLCSSK